MKNQETHKKSHKNYVIAAIVILGLAILAVAGGSSVEEEQTKNEHPESQEASQSAESEKTPLSEEAAEKECQDAKYYQNSDYYRNNVGNIISVSEYNFNMLGDGTYDSDGNSIFGVYWSGKGKNGEKITFSCYISGPNDDNLTVHYISGNLNDIWKSTADLMYNSYDKDGNRIEQ